MCLQAEVQGLLGGRASLRDGARAVLGMIAAIETFGKSYTGPRTCTSCWPAGRSRRRAAGGDYPSKSG